MQRELNIVFETIRKNIHEELHLKKVSFAIVFPKVKYLKTERFRNLKQTLKLLNGGRHWIVSKIANDDEMCILPCNVTAWQEGKVCVFADVPGGGKAI